MLIYFHELVFENIGMKKKIKTYWFLLENRKKRKSQKFYFENAIKQILCLRHIFDIYFKKKKTRKEKEIKTKKLPERVNFCIIILLRTVNSTLDRFW